MTWEDDRIADLEDEQAVLADVVTELAALDETEAEDYVIAAAVYGKPMPDQVQGWIDRIDDQIADLGG